MEIKIASVDSILICFENEISKETSSKVSSYSHFLKSLKNKAFIEIVPSYSTILLTYDIFKYDFYSLKDYLKKNITIENQNQSECKIIEIDVYYGKEVALDLEEISIDTNLSIKEIIDLHSKKLYDVYTIGFLPGFAYLASVDEKIARPRLKSPRKIIPKNSVAIADTQTAIYPKESPGGWNIIGRTAKELFDKNLESLCPLAVGDKVKFNAISKDIFLSQGGII